MMDQTYTVPAKFGIRAMMLITAIFAVVFGFTKAIDVELRIVAPVLSFVVLICFAQILFGRIPRIASSAVGSLVFPISAYIDPMFDGELHFQLLPNIDLFWLVLCGGVAGYLGGVLLAGIFLVADCLQRERQERTYAVPQRFGIGTMLLATTLFAVVYAFLTWANARTWHLFFFTTFVGTVGGAQMLLQRAPRWASILAGGIFLPLSVLCFVPAGLQGRWQAEQSPLPSDAGFMLTLILTGLMVGYLGGTLISGVFLLSDYVVRLAVTRRERRPVNDLIDDEPLAGSVLSQLAKHFVASRRP